jgi:hypothetical protein
LKIVAYLLFEWVCVIEPKDESTLVLIRQESVQDSSLEVTDVKVSRGFRS